MDRWITDTPTSERFPLYTRGNADEVGPEPYSPLGWTLAWEQGAVPGVADGWCSLGGFLPEEFRSPVPESFGNWGGYFYNQVSIGRVFGVRAPGATPDIIDESFFGKNSSVPSYVEDPRDESPERSAAIGEVFGAVLGATEQPAYLTEFVEQVRAWRRERPDLGALSDSELIAYGRAANFRLRRTWDIYTVITLGATVGPGVVAAVAAGVGRPEAGLTVFTAIGGVESAGTAGRVWELSRRARNSPVVSAELDAGTEGLLERLRRSGDADAHAFVAAFDELLEVDGHRGPNEWDIMSDSWLLRPELPLGMIDLLRRQTDDQSPSNRVAQHATHRDEVIAELTELVAADPQASAMLAMGLRSGQLFYQGREMVKDAAVRVMLEAKLPFVELGRRLAERGVIQDPKHVFMLLDSELDEIVTSPEGWRERLAERADDFASLSLRMPPYVVSHGVPVPPISEWPLRTDQGAVTAAVVGDTLTGTGVSPGTARGRARVCFDLSEIDELEPGDILVCSTTDPSWVPLFMIAGGVVCDVGAPGSHAAIVSREIGVPCVVSVSDARRRIQPGAMLEIDGATGTVTVLEG
jgi:phosphohistidine swiveling domain-containing protein